MNNQIKMFIKILICVALVVFVLLLAISYSDIMESINIHDYQNLVSILIGRIRDAVFIDVVFFMLFDKWIWKWKIVNKFLDVPVLASLYACTFISDYDGKERKATLKIKQSFLRISVTFKTEESDSENVVDAQIQDSDNRKRLIYTYLNEPNADIRKGSPMHYGTAIFNLSEYPKIEGNYYTDRGTSGHIKCETKGAS